MTFTVTVPEVAEWPWWVFLAAGVVAWYTLAAAVVRWVGRRGPGPMDVFCEVPDGRFAFWLMSPTFLPLTVLCWAGTLFAKYVLTPRGER